MRFSLLFLLLLLFSECFSSVRMASTSNESSPETPTPLSVSSSSSGAESGVSSSTAVLSTDVNVSDSATPKRLGSVWKSPVWEYFGVAEDNKFAECGDMVSRGGSTARNFNTTNLDHLKSKHHSTYVKFLEVKNKRDKERQANRNVRVHKGGFTGLRQLSLQGSRQLNKQWDINDARAKAVHHDQCLGEMIALDYQPMSVVEDMGFRRFVSVLEPKYT